LHGLLTQCCRTPGPGQGSTPQDANAGPRIEQAAPAQSPARPALLRGQDCATPATAAQAGTGKQL